MCANEGLRVPSVWANSSIGRKTRRKKKTSQNTSQPSPEHDGDGIGAQEYAEKKRFAALHPIPSDTNQNVQLKSDARGICSFDLSPPLTKMATLAAFVPQQDRMI